MHVDKARGFTFFLAMLVFCFACGNVFGQDRIEGEAVLDELAKLLRDRSAGFSTAFECAFERREITGPRLHELEGKTQEEKIANAENAKMEEIEDGTTAGKFLYDPRTGRYKIEFEHVSKWNDGPTNSVSLRKQRSYDGEMFGALARSKPGAKSVPEFKVEDVSSPVVADLYSATIENNNLQADLIRCCIPCLSPSIPKLYAAPGTEDLFWNHESLLTSLRAQTSSVSRTELAENGILQFRFLDDEDASRKIPRYYLLEIDGSNGLIKKIALGSEISPRNSELKVEYSRIGMDWVPSEIFGYDWLNGRGYRMSISKVSMKPNSGVGDYEIDIPPGTIVNDHVNEMFYVAGVGPLDEALAMKEYARQHNLKVEAAPRNSISKWSLLAFAVLGAIVLVIFRRWRSKFGATSSICLLGLFFCGAGRADEPEQCVWNGHQWEVLLGGKVPTVVSQCGFNVTVLALESFGIDYSAEFISRELRPTKKGIRISDIRTCLILHGLEVDSYKNVPLGTLKERLNVGELAIVAISKRYSSNLHYVILTLSKDRKPIFIDPPHAPRLLEEWSQGALKTIDQSVVLLCKRSAESVDVELRSPTFDISATKAVGGRVEGEIVVANNGTSPVAITEVEKSCGCVEIEFSPRIIDGNSEASFQFFIDINKWGAGVKSQNILFRTSHGEQLKFAIQGEGIPRSVSSLGKTSSNLYASRMIDLPLDCGKLVSRTLDISIGHMLAENLELSSSDRWCEPRCVNAESGIVTLQLKLELGESELLKVSVGETLRCSIAMSLDREGVPLVGRVDVNIIRSHGAEIAEIRSSALQRAYSLKLPPGTRDGWELTNLPQLEDDLEFKRIDGNSWEILVQNADFGMKRCLLKHSEHPSIEVAFELAD